MKKTLAFLFILQFFILVSAHAQDAPTHIAIIPFSAATPKAQSITQDVQALVTNCFVNKDRFYLLDRGATDKIKKELDGVKDHASMYSKIVAEQGHLANAEYIITGSVDTLSFGHSLNKDVLGTDIKNSLDAKKYTKYHATIHVVIEINKVETGRVIKSNPYIVTSRDFDDSAPALIIDNLLCRLKTQIQTDIRTLFPPAMLVVSVDKTKKNGLPDVVLVNGGAEMFDTGKQQAVCPGDDEISVASKTSAVGSMFKKAKGVFGQNKITLDVISHEEINAGGKIYKRDKVIGQVRVESVEGDLTACTVLKGAEDIKSYMDGKKPIYVKIQTADTP